MNLRKIKIHGKDYDCYIFNGYSDAKTFLYSNKDWSIIYADEDTGKVYVSQSKVVKEQTMKYIKYINETVQGEPLHYHNELMKEIYIGVSKDRRGWRYATGTSSVIQFWFKDNTFVEICQYDPTNNGPVEVFYSTRMNPSEPESGTLKKFKYSEINNIIKYANGLVSKYE